MRGRWNTHRQLVYEEGLKAAVCEVTQVLLQSVHQLTHALMPRRRSAVCYAWTRGLGPLPDPPEREASTAELILLLRIRKITLPQSAALPDLCCTQWATSCSFAHVIIRHERHHKCGCRGRSPCTHQIQQAMCHKLDACDSEMQANEQIQIHHKQLFTGSVHTAPIFRDGWAYRGTRPSHSDKDCRARGLVRGSSSLCRHAAVLLSRSSYPYRLSLRVQEHMRTQP